MIIRMTFECNLLPGLREAQSAGRAHLFFPQDRHLNIAGNRRAAEILFQFLRQRHQ